jgi:hypothetical protein
MDDWQKDWMKAFDLLAEGVDQLCQDVAKEVENAVEGFADLSNEIFEQIEEAIAPNLDEWDQQMTEWTDSVLQLFFDFETDFNQSAEPFTQTLEPMLNEHPACVGCRNYHGYSYNGVPFVCAMHPYGWEADEACPDWDSTWQR